ncbi:transglutaminase-like domain-containing protein [Sanguibacter sp. 25GB23B1]|uniref:transglutaminase domain-containing protein n=1 Tax=unclassified Sanguibacter TaxID=2645534 RepID=UPI0032AEA876
MTTSSTPPPPPSSSGEPPWPVAPTKKRRSRGRTALVVSAVVGALALGYGFVAFFGDDRPEPTSGPTGPADVGELQFASVQTQVGKSQPFRFSRSFDLATLQVDGRPAVVTDLVGVYLDPLLTMPAPDVYMETFRGPITVTPRDTALFGNDEVTGTRIPLNVGGQWGFSDTYYIAERRDLATGAPLPEPKVTAFSVPTVAPKTSVAFEVDSQGVGHFSWDAIPGAEEYYVVAVEKMAQLTLFEEGATVSIIGETADTTWSTIEQDERVQEGLTGAGVTEFSNGVVSTNYPFRTYRMGEDWAHDPAAPLLVETHTTLMFGIVAKTPDGLSPISLLGEDIDGTLPISIAFTAAKAMGTNGNDVHTVAQLPTRMPVTMSDGRTVLRPMRYDVDAMVATESILGTQDATGAFTQTGTDERYRVGYTVDGTLLVGSYTLDEPDLATAQAGVRTVVARVQAETVKNGAGESYSYQTDSNAFDPHDVSSTAPDVGYPVSGTNPLTTYLAANLVAGEEYIDLSAYLPGGSMMTTSGISYMDAFREALLQNPFILGKVSMEYDEPSQIMGVKYEDYDSPEERAAAQARLAEEVEAVTARIITDGMSDEDKVRAINGYLTSSAEYDYAALDEGLLGPDRYPNAWTATGVLFDKKGVCASYAAAFTVLARAAGLETMTVSGVTLDSGGRHAWNKVLVDGAWRVVDATWNDSPAPDQYLLLTDAQTNESRTQDSDWVLDSRVADYAAL